jgi:hypothetical protein
MAVNGFPLTDRIRLQLDEAPTAWGMRERAERLCGLPRRRNLNGLGWKKRASSKKSGPGTCDLKRSRTGLRRPFRRRFNQSHGDIVVQGSRSVCASI